MKLKFKIPWHAGSRRAGWLGVTVSLMAWTSAQAQPTILSTVPGNGATGVSTTAAVVFTFSEAMDTNATTATFVNVTTSGELVTTAYWSNGNTVLACFPNNPFPTSSHILWVVSGQSAGETNFGGVPEGIFTTGTSGGGGTGTVGTNQYTAFAVGQAAYYSQTSTSAPVLDTTIPPYTFFADVTLSSNQSAISATVELPSTSVSNLTQPLMVAGQFLLTAGNASQAALDGIFGDGNYVFTVTAASSNEQVTVNFPSSLAQPPAPQISNFTAAQSVNPAQPFTLTWNAFAGATTSDEIYITIGSAYGTPQPATSNVLAGTATSLVIPANALTVGSNYDCFISFYHILLPNTTALDYTTAAYRYSATEFNLTTVGGAVTPVVLTSAAWSGHTFSFNVISAAGQHLLVEYNTSLLLSSPWQTLLNTTNSSGVLPVSDAVNTTNQHLFYRAVTAP
jgi:hypothetical protein